MWSYSSTVQDAYLEEQIVDCSVLINIFIEIIYINVFSSTNRRILIKKITGQL